MLSPLYCKLKQNFVLALLKFVLNFFSVLPMLSLISSVVPSPKTKKLFLKLLHEMMNYYQHQKLQHSWQSHYQKSTNLHQVLLHSHYTHTFINIFYHNSQIKQVIFNIKLLNEFIGQLSKL